MTSKDPDDADRLADHGPQPELAPDRRLAEDTKFGFVLTVAGLAVLAGPTLTRAR